MTRTWETALGIITMVASVPILLVSLFDWPYSSIPPQQNFVTEVAIVIAALGIGLIHDSRYKSKSIGSAQSDLMVPSLSLPKGKRGFGFWAIAGTFYVGLVVVSTGIGYLFGTGIPAYSVAMVIAVGVVIVVIGILMAWSTLSHTSIHG